MLRARRVTGQPFSGGCPTPSPPQETSSKKSNRKLFEAMSRYSYIGIFFGVAIVLGWLAGRWADRRWHTGPWLEIIGILFGVASGFRELYRVSKQALKDER